MEVQELISYYLFDETSKIEICFRLDIDSEDEVRTDTLDLSEAIDFGYNFIDEDEKPYYDDEYDEDDWDDDFTSINEDLLINFINEYYIVNLDKLPKAELL